MDLAEISPEMAEISPDVNNFAGKCWDLGSVGFLRFLKRKPASRPVVFGFWKPRSAADRRNDRVGRFRIGRRSDPPGGSGLGWVWTALPRTTYFGSNIASYHFAKWQGKALDSADFLDCMFKVNQYSSLVTLASSIIIPIISGFKCNKSLN